MNYHDPIRQSKYLRQTLSQDKKPVGFFISAGCPLAVSMPEGKWPLIPDVAGLTKYIKDEIEIVKKELDELFPIKKNPLGAFVGILVTIKYTYRTVQNPLTNAFELKAKTQATAPEAVREMLQGGNP